MAAGQSGYGSTQVVDRIARLLAIVAESGREGCRLRDLVERSALNRATAYRLVDNLRRHGFLRQGADGKTYHLGLQLLSLGAMAGSHEGLREIARPCLMRLAAEYSDTFFLFVRDGYENVCIDIRDGRYPVRSYTRGIGGRVPLGVGQAGLAVLAFLEDDDREEVLSRNRGNLESNFAVRVETLPDFAEIRARGYVSDTGSCMIPEYTGVGAPIFDSNGQPVAAISSCALVSRFTPARAQQVSQAVLAETRLISARLNPLDPLFNANHGFG